MLTRDWITRRVDALTRSVAYLVFQKKPTGYVPAGAAEDVALDELHRRLLERINVGDIGRVGDPPFVESNPNDRRYLELAMNSCARFSGPTDARLKATGFDRNELEEGLRDMVGWFGMSLLQSEKELG